MATWLRIARSIYSQTVRLVAFNSQVFQVAAHKLVFYKYGVLHGELSRGFSEGFQNLYIAALMLQPKMQI